MLAMWIWCCASTARSEHDPDQPEVSISIVPSRKSVTPGEQFPIAVVFNLKDGWHIHTNDPKVPASWRAEGFEAIPTQIVVLSAKGLKVGKVQWPPPHIVKADLVANGKPEDYGFFDGRAIAYLPVIVDPDAIGQVELTLGVGYQACAESCLFPVEPDSEEGRHHLVIPVVVGQAASEDRAGGDPADFAAFDLRGLADLAAGRTPDKIAKFNVFGWSFEVNTHGLGLVLLLILAALGGFILNLTPCVLPLIPIKILGLSQAAGNPKRCLYLGIVMSVGVVVFWLAIGGAIAYISGFSAISTLFQTKWFSLAVGVVIGVFAAGMLGAFSTGLPQWVYLLNPKQETTLGAFLFGVLTAVLSTPCTAPFMGSAAAWAATRPPIITISTFAAIGVGMALPYLILAANPAWINKVPRTGPASELVKQTIGILLIAVAVFFLGTGLDPMLREPVDPPIRWYWWIIAASVCIAAAWLIRKTFRITQRSGPRLVWSIVGVLLAVSSVFVATRFTDRGPVRWIGYTPERFEKAKAEGKVIVLDFTAEWCINCKAIEATVLHTPEVYGVLNSSGVSPQRVDLTGGNAPGDAKLKELKWNGIPLLAVYGPLTGYETPAEKFGDGYTPQLVLDAIRKAGGDAITKSVDSGKRR